MSSALLLVVLTIGSVGAEDPTASVERAVDDLVADLFRSDGPGTLQNLPADRRIGVRLEASSVDPGVSRLVLLLLLARLERAGLREIALPAVGSFELDAAEAARARGAEQILVLALSADPGEGPRTVQLLAELRLIDRGFWEDPPAAARAPVLSVARASLTLSQPVDPPPASQYLESARPRRLQALPLEVLALLRCDLDGRAPEELVVLSRAGLWLYAAEGDHFRQESSLSFIAFEKARARPRDAIGQLSCDLPHGAEPARIAVAHSDLLRGYLFAAKAGRLVQKAELPAPVLAALGGGNFLLGSPDEGRNRWSKSLQLQTPNGVKPVVLPWPVQELLRVREGPSLFALSVSHQLVELDDEYREKRILGTSGPGLSAFLGKEGLSFATTSSRTGSEDHLRIVTPARRTSNAARFSGAVRASCVSSPLASFDGTDRRELLLSVAPPNPIALLGTRTTPLNEGGPSDLYRVEIGGAER